MFLKDFKVDDTNFPTLNSEESKDISEIINHDPF